jgi:hypothetical protein
MAQVLQAIFCLHVVNVHTDSSRYPRHVAITLRNVFGFGAVQMGREVLCNMQWERILSHFLLPYYQQSTVKIRVRSDDNFGDTYTLSYISKRSVASNS